MKNVENVVEHVDVGKMEEGEVEEGYLYPQALRGNHASVAVLRIHCLCCLVLHHINNRFGMSKSSSLVVDDVSIRLCCCKLKVDRIQKRYQKTCMLPTLRAAAM